MKLLVRTISILVLLSIINSGLIKANDDPKLILIHLDAVSSHYILQEMEKGNMPNVSRIFGEEGKIDHVITYFPSKTPTIISSIRMGESVRKCTQPDVNYLYLKA